MTEIFVNHQLLTLLAGESGENHIESEEYRGFLDEIRGVVDSLPGNHSEVIRGYYFECRGIDEIAEEMGLSRDDIRILLHKAIMKLKPLLAEKVKSRWPKRFANLRVCPICNHPKRKAIEAMVRSKKCRESWAMLNRRLKRRFGMSIHPPLVIIRHMRFHV